MNKFKEIQGNKWVKFGIVSAVYILWFVVWGRSPWMLLGLIVIYDIYISKFMYRLFWEKHREKKRTNSSYRKTMEWVEALLFAAVAATVLKIYFFGMYVIPTPSMEKTLLVGDYLYVSKVAYGPQMPNTPLSFPFVHNVMPLSKTSNSFVEWIKRPYKRLAGFGSVERYDAVVFNYPMGDTVIVPQGYEYYDVLDVYRRNFGEKEGREKLHSEAEIRYRPVDKRDNYIKRTIGLPGDSVKVVAGTVFVNGEQEPYVPGREYMYYIRTDGKPINTEILDKMGINPDEYRYDRETAVYTMYSVSEENMEKIGKFPNVVEIHKYEDTDDSYQPEIFPHSPRYSWTVDNYGPLWVPAEGTTIALDMDNLPLYRRIIETYENNELEVKDGTIYINGEAAASYKFKMDYYFMMGDNRHNSLDSRFWGFVPEDHIVGKASFVWLSIDKNKTFPANIRWREMFKKVK